MQPVITLRPARHDETAALNALILRSKAHWGYDAEFMARSRGVLELHPDWIDQGRVTVAEIRDRQGGVLALLPQGAGEEAIEMRFVDPSLLGHGLGRRLVDHAKAAALRQGAKSLSVVSDPHAQAFYERCGARLVGAVASEVQPGRMLPHLVFHLVP